MLNYLHTNHVKKISPKKEKKTNHVEKEAKIYFNQNKNLAINWIMNRSKLFTYIIIIIIFFLPFCNNGSAKVSERLMKF